jgi:hypothetical protein
LVGRDLAFLAKVPRRELVRGISEGHRVSCLVPYVHQQLLVSCMGRDSLGTQTDFAESVHTFSESITQLDVDIRYLPSVLPFDEGTANDSHLLPRLELVTTVPSLAASAWSRLAVS